MLKCFANAKINLLLDITGREENGYHTVNNIMQTVSLSDTVTLSCECDGIRVAYDDGYPVTDKDICLKAANEYERVSGRKINADIFINKVIPTAAGLGGNSSAAAAVLLLLQKEYNLIADADLLSIAESLGADVPFFLVGGTALCEHYGERIAPLPDFSRHYVVIAKKGNKESTAEMYKKIDTVKWEKKADLEGMLTALSEKNGSAVIDKMFNAFESVSNSEDILYIKEIMNSSGALGSMLSGSGPAVFGLFENQEKAENCCKALCDAGITAYLCETVDKGIIIE